MIAEAYRLANEPPPVLIACVRDPVQQAVSWWKYENNAISWGESMGLTEWNIKLRSEAYPPKSISEALAFSQSTFVRESYEKAERLVSTKIDEGILPPWAMTWPAGQLGSIGRSGNFSSNIQRYERVFKSYFSEPNQETVQENANRLSYVSVIPIEFLSDDNKLNDTLLSILNKAALR
eukprot:CAMPEP_0184862620 /NCGR_PEP_ID=MMETSP0580-20130426/7067_1 /TAXON_ID=1118495 /ORGANISM="Dactyliosolen fragilissimus" /LENGTH=177 /DNA_ID=CAMNT_0027360571 /DNA_START=446 /DNA_END=975 /DNA_ORIENTATION=+